MKRVVVGVSGGVDSTIAAYRLKQAGFDVQAVFMKNWEEDDTDTHCSAAEDRKDAEQVCTQMGIPFHTVNFASEYWDHVFSTFLDSYSKGWTPNPDIICNQEIKFKAFLEYAATFDADYIATGHYAKRVETPHGVQLHRAVDENKDQTYFLYRIAPAALSKALFPIADLPKPEVRALAHSLNLPNFNRKDSTGICFIGEKRFTEFLKRYIPAQPGTIQTPEGRHIGTHAGLMFYTLGQRSGLGIGGLKNSEPSPWYVVGKKLSERILYVTQNPEHPWHTSTELYSSDAHWLGGAPPATQFDALARIRHRQALEPCEVTVTSTDMTVRFKRPQAAVTPGQACVLYQGTHCLGGGTIFRTNSPGGLQP